MTNEKTMVKISKVTAKKLKERKITRFDTYDEVINRMLQKINKIEEKYADERD